MSFLDEIHPAAYPIANAFKARVPLNGMLQQIQALSLKAEGHTKQIERSAWELPADQLATQINRILNDMPSGFRSCELMIDEGGTYPTTLKFSEDFHRNWTLERGSRY